MYMYTCVVCVCGVCMCCVYMCECVYVCVRHCMYTPKQYSYISVVLVRACNFSFSFSNLAQ